MLGLVMLGKHFTNCSTSSAHKVFSSFFQYLFCMYRYFACIYACVLCACTACGGQKLYDYPEAGVTNVCELTYRYCDPNLGALQEQKVVLIAEAISPVPVFSF